MEIHYLFGNAIDEIDILEEYYLFQSAINTLRLNEEKQKYQYGLAIYKYFCAKAHQEQNPHCLTDVEKKFLEEEFIETKKDNGSPRDFQYKIRNSNKYKDKYELDPIISERKMRSLYENPEILNNSVLIMLLVRYETVIAEIYRKMLYKYSDAYLQDKSIKYSVLMSIKSDIDTIKNNFIDTEVEEFMRKPLKEWYQSFEKNHKIKFCFEKEFDIFKELYYRRNLLVHNQGIVNESYLNGIGQTTNYKIGEKVKIDSSYLFNAFNITRIILIKTFWGLNKLCSEKEKLANILFDVGYKYMTERKWNISQCCFSILKEYADLSAADLWFSTVNYLISIKNQEGLSSIEKEIKEKDISLMSPRMAIAKPALLDDFEKINEMLETSIGKDISVREVKEWPLFLQYRGCPLYKEFVEKHKEIFSYETYSSEESDRLDQICTNE